MFEDDGGLDVVRAMHLDLSGRPLHCGRRLEGERFLVENLGIAARPYYRGEPKPLDIPDAPSRLRLAWFSPDDLKPLVTMAVQQGAFAGPVSLEGAAVQIFSHPVDERGRRPPASGRRTWTRRRNASWARTWLLPAAR